MQVGQIALALAFVELEVEPHRVRQHPDQRVRSLSDVRGRVGLPREPIQQGGGHHDILGQVEPQHDRQFLRIAPGRIHLLCGLRVDAGVPFRHRGGVAAVVEGPAHDHQPAQQLRQSRLGAQGQRQVRQRAGGDPDQLAGVGVGRAHPRLGGVVGSGCSGRLGQLGIPESLRSVRVLRGAQRCRQRDLRPRGHRDAGDPTQFQQRQVVAAHLMHANISRRRGDADQVGLRAGEQVGQGHRVVDAGVHVDEDRTGRPDRRGTHQCTPGTSRTACLTGRGTRIAGTGRTRRRGRREAGRCCGAGRFSATPRAAAESG